MLYCRIMNFLTQIKLSFLRDLLDIRRRDVEQFMGDFPYRDSGSWQVQLFLSFVDHLAPSLIFFQLQWYEDSLPYLKQMLRAQYLGVSLAIVICECSLNH